MKTINTFIKETKINGYTVEIIVAKMPEAKSYNTYNIDDIKDALKDAIRTNCSLFWKVSRGDFKYISSSFQEAWTKVHASIKYL